MSMLDRINYKFTTGLLLAVLLVIGGLAIQYRDFLSISLLVDRPLRGAMWSSVVRHSTIFNGEEIFCYDEGSQFCENVLARITDNQQLEFEKQRNLGYAFAPTLDIGDLNHHVLYSCVNLDDANEGTFTYRITTDESVCDSIDAFPYALGQILVNSGDLEVPLALYQDAGYLSTFDETDTSGEIGYLAAAQVNQLVADPDAGPDTTDLCAELPTSCYVGSESPLCVAAVPLCSNVNLPDLSEWYDVDGNNCVGEGDVDAITAAVGEEPDGVNAKYDVNSDGEIDALDSMAVTEYIDDPDNSEHVCEEPITDPGGDSDTGDGDTATPTPTPSPTPTPTPEPDTGGGDTATPTPTATPTSTPTATPTPEPDSDFDPPPSDIDLDGTNFQEIEISPGGWESVSFWWLSNTAPTGGSGTNDLLFTDGFHVYDATCAERLEANVIIPNYGGVVSIASDGNRGHWNHVVLKYSTVNGKGVPEVYLNGETTRTYLAGHDEVPSVSNDESLYIGGPGVIGRVEELTIGGDVLSQDDFEHGLIDRGEDPLRRSAHFTFDENVFGADVVDVINSSRTSNCEVDELTGITDVDTRTTSDLAPLANNAGAMSYSELYLRGTGGQPLSLNLDALDRENGAISLWFKSSDLAVVDDANYGEGSIRTLFFSETPSFTTGLAADATKLIWIEGDNKLFVGNDDGNPDQLMTTFVPDQWNHVVWTHSDDRLRGYLNGVEFGSVISGRSEWYNWLSVGLQYTTRGLGYSNSQAWTDYLDSFGDYSGAFDDVSFFDRGLTSAEVQTLYNERTN